MAKKTYTIGLDLGGTMIKSGIADKDGNILITRVDRSQAPFGQKAVLKALIQSEKFLIDYAK